MARITKISIEGLFGVFDYEIPLNQDDRITILTGPNGFGKTTILQLIYTLVTDLQTLLDQALDDSEGLSQFRKVTLFLEKGWRIEFTQDFFKKKTQNKSSDLYYWEGMKIAIYNSSSSFPSEYWVESETEFDGLVATPIFNPEENTEPEKIQDNKTDLIEQVLYDLNVDLIASERLMSITPSTLKGYKITYDIQPKVKKYATELTQHLESRVKQYAEISQRLDKTYPFRVMEKEAHDTIPEFYFVQELQTIRSLSRRLASVSVLDDTDNGEIERLEAALTREHLDTATKNMLEVYISDSKDKYAVFTDTLQKLELFQSILNRKLACSHKQISFSRDEGFLIRYKQAGNDRYPSSPVPLTALSSGEQHQLVLFYELLFVIEPGSLVLIDEPEISLHLSWQVDFLEDLQEISRLADLDFLIATHAPSIIEDRWDLVVELNG